MNLKKEINKQLENLYQKPIFLALFLVCMFLVGYIMPKVIEESKMTAVKYKNTIMPEPTITPTPTFTPPQPKIINPAEIDKDETANWKTLTPAHNYYSFKYPTTMYVSPPESNEKWTEKKDYYNIEYLEGNPKFFWVNKNEFNKFKDTAPYYSGDSGGGFYLLRIDAKRYPKNKQVTEAEIQRMFYGFGDYLYDNSDGSYIEFTDTNGLIWKASYPLGGAAPDGVGIEAYTIYNNEFFSVTIYSTLGSFGQYLENTKTNGFIDPGSQHGKEIDKKFRQMVLQILSTFKFTDQNQQDDTANWKTYTYDFNNLNLTFKAPPELFVTFEKNDNSVTLFIENHEHNNTTQTNPYQLYGLYQWDITYTLDELNNNKEDYDSSTVQDIRIDGNPGIRGQYKGERNRYVTQFLKDNHMFTLATSEPTKENEILSNKIIDTFHFITQ